MKKALQFIFLILFLFPAFKAFSQDTIVKIDGEKIQAKVLKVMENKVEYQRFGFADGPLYTLRKGDISEIKYSNGMVDKFNMVFGNSKRAIKFEMLSPLCGDFVFAYEQPISAHVNAEIKLGIIKGADNVATGAYDNPAQGIFVKAGLKFVPPQSNNSFSGFYIKPEFIYSNYASSFVNTYNYGNQNTPFNYSSVGGDLVFGYQAIASSHFLIDTYFGWGFAYINVSSNNPNLNNNYEIDDYTNYGFSRVSDSNYNNFVNKYSTLILTFGVLVGYSF